MEPSRTFNLKTFEDPVDDCKLCISLIVIEDGGIVLCIVSTVDKERDVSTIINDELWSKTVGESDGIKRKLPILFKGLSLPRKDGCSCRGDSRGGVVLGAKDVAAAPADVSTKGGERLDEDCRLDGHVEGSTDTEAVEGLLFGVLDARGHESGHLVLCKDDLLASKGGQTDVADF